MTRTSVPNAVVAVLAVLTLGARPVRAQEGTLDTTFNVRAGTALVVNNQQGEVVVRAWNRSQIRLVAEYDRARIEVDESAGRVSVRSVSRHGDNEVSYTITVPNGTPVEVGGVSTDVNLSGVCGPATVNTVSGDVNVQCASGDVLIQSVSGDVVVADARGGVEAGSTSGDVDVHGARSDVSAHSVSGDISLYQIDGAQVSAETVSGEIQYSGRIQDSGRYQFEAHSGDVTVQVTGTLNATIAVETFSGDFESDFPIEIQPGTTLGHKWEFRQGNGSARVRLSSFSGTIGLRRGAAAPSREE
jgi:DUF4097 and DUF4098 domain-containing protein YvlB